MAAGDTPPSARVDAASGAAGAGGAWLTEVGLRRGCPAAARDGDQTEYIPGSERANPLLTKDHEPSQSHEPYDFMCARARTYHRARRGKSGGSCGGPLRHLCLSLSLVEEYISATRVAARAALDRAFATAATPSAKPSRPTTTTTPERSRGGARHAADEIGTLSSKTRSVDSWPSQTALDRLHATLSSIPHDREPKMSMTDVNVKPYSPATGT